MFRESVNDPPPRHERYPLSIYRVKTKRPVQVVVNTKWYFGFFTHYVDERNVGCPGEDRCKECKKGAQRRWNGAVGITDIKGNNQRALLFTPEACLVFKDANQEEHGLFRCGFSLWRETFDKRSKLMARFEGLFRGDYAEMDMQTLVDNVIRVFKPNLLLTGSEQFTRMGME